MQWAWAREDPAAGHWAGARIWGKEVASCPGFVLRRIPGGAILPAAPPPQPLPFAQMPMSTNPP